MDDKISLNGHHPADTGDGRLTNPYAEAVIGREPPEIVEFGLHTDPYANMVPRISSASRPDEPDIGPDLDVRRRHPALIVISILLVVVLVLPIMAEVFARLIH